MVSTRLRDKLLIAAALAGTAAAVATAAQREPYYWGTADDQWARDPSYARSRTLCLSVRDRRLPQSDRPDPATAARLRGCDSEALYYGIGRPADPVQARLCAIVEMEEAGPDPGPSLAGRAMLTTIYANGRGAARDLDLAIHLACGAWAAPAEMAARVDHLARLRTRPAARERFDFCDDITSGVMGGYCVGRASRIEDVARAATTRALVARWPAADRRAFAPLQRAHSAYVRAHLDGEVDMSGTLRGAIATAAEDRLEQSFLETLQRLAAGRALTADSLAAADSALNAAWRARMAEPFDDGSATPTREGVLAAQRAWLRYRDAFAAFAAVRFPRASRDRVLALLTRQRIRILTNNDPF